MKKTLFLLMLLVSIPVFFTGCAEDMYEDSTSLEDLYRQKAAEFSRKYGVEVTLNEEKISEIVAKKSLEELEAEIKSFAKLHIKMQETIPSYSIKQKMRITRRKTLSENQNQITGSFDVYGNLFCYSYDLIDSTFININTSCTGYVNWSLGNMVCSLSVHINNIAGYPGEMSFPILPPNFTYDESKRDIEVEYTSQSSRLYIGLYYRIDNVNCSILRSFSQQEGCVNIYTNNT